MRLNLVVISSMLVNYNGDQDYREREPWYVQHKEAIGLVISD